MYNDYLFLMSVNKKENYSCAAKQENMQIAEFVDQAAAAVWRTLHRVTADLHGRLPLSVVTGSELVSSFQNVTLITEVLNHGTLGQSVARQGVAFISTVLRLTWWLTNCWEINFKVSASKRNQSFQSEVWRRAVFSIQKLNLLTWCISISFLRTEWGHWRGLNWTYCHFWHSEADQRTSGLRRCRWWCCSHPACILDHSCIVAACQQRRSHDLFPSGSHGHEAQLRV